MLGEKTPVTEVAQVLGVSRATLYRRVPELAEARTRPVMNEPDAGVTPGSGSAPRRAQRDPRGHRGVQGHR